MKHRVSGAAPSVCGHRAMGLRQGTLQVRTLPYRVVSAVITDLTLASKPTLLAAAGDTTVTERLLKGWSPTSGGYVFKVHLDGYNIQPYLEGKEAHSPRHNFYYFNDDGMLVALRFDNWKVVFCEQPKPGGFIVWSYPFLCGRVDKLFNLRMDPTERADIVSDQYYDWLARNACLLVQGQMLAGQFMETFKEYPPSQPTATFTIDPEGIVKAAKSAQQKRE